MKIAVFVNKAGQTETFNAGGEIRVYEEIDNRWEVIGSFKCEVDYSSMTNTRKSLNRLMDKLGDCNILVGDKIIGLAYNMLDRGGFHIWEFKGKPDEFLDIVKQKEEDEERMTSKEDQDKNGLVELGDGRYFINVKEILLNDGAVSSKKLLKPFFDDVTFFGLHIVFSHVPPWLEPDLNQRNLEMIVEAQTVGEVQVLIRPKVCS